MVGAKAIFTRVRSGIDSVSTSRIWHRIWQKLLWLISFKTFVVYPKLLSISDAPFHQFVPTTLFPLTNIFLKIKMTYCHYSFWSKTSVEYSTYASDLSFDDSLGIFQMRFSTTRVIISSIELYLSLNQLQPNEFRERLCNNPDSKVHGANMGPAWGRQDPGGPHVGHINLAIWVQILLNFVATVQFAICQSISWFAYRWLCITYDYAAEN